MPSLLLPLLLLPQGELLLTSVVHSTLCKVDNCYLIYMLNKLHSTYILELCRYVSALNVLWACSGMPLTSLFSSLGYLF
jgi:hypothetical protein